MSLFKPMLLIMALYSNVLIADPNDDYLTCLNLYIESDNGTQKCDLIAKIAKYYNDQKACEEKVDDLLSDYKIAAMEMLESDDIAPMLKAKKAKEKLLKQAKKCGQVISLEPGRELE